VEGKVVFPDGKPVTNGTIEFEPKNPDLKDMKARGEIQPDGSYRLTTVTEGDGAVEGPHRVIVVVSTRNGPVIDPRYQAFDSSGLDVMVGPRQNHIPLRVEKPTPRSVKPGLRNPGP
jgi:hypothetical protein